MLEHIHLLEEPTSISGWPGPLLSMSLQKLCSCWLKLSFMLSNQVLRRARLKTTRRLRIHQEETASREVTMRLLMKLHSCSWRRTLLFNQFSASTSISWSCSDGHFLSFWLWFFTTNQEPYMPLFSSPTSLLLFTLFSSSNLSPNWLEFLFWFPNHYCL